MTVLYACSVVKYVVCTTFRRAGRRQAFSPHSGYFLIPLRNLAPFDSVCFRLLFITLNSGFTLFRYFSIRLYLQYRVPYKPVNYSRIQLVRISTRFPPLPSAAYSKHSIRQIWDTRGGAGHSAPPESLRPRPEPRWYVLPRFDPILTLGD